MFTFMQILGKGLSHSIAPFLEIGRIKDIEHNGYYGEYAVHANLRQSITDNIGDEGGTDGKA